MLRTIIFSFLFLLGTTQLTAQSLEFGVYGGVSLYSGDLSPVDAVDQLELLRPAGGAFGRFNVGSLLSFRLGYNYLQVFGDDALAGRPRNLNFESDIHELSFLLEINLVQIRLGARSILSPYAYGGMAAYRFNPTTRIGGSSTIELQPLGTEGQGLPGYPAKYELNQWAVPFGGGLKFYLGGQWVLGVEISARKLFTDYLDDVSDQLVVYQDLIDAGNTQAAAIGYPNFDPDTMDPRQPMRRGGDKDDLYMTGGITLSYLFGDFGGNRKPGRRGGKELPCYQF